MYKMVSYCDYVYCGQTSLSDFFGGVVVVGAICYSTICIGTHTGQIAVQWLCRDWSAIEKQMHIISLYTLSPFLFGCSYQSEKVRGMGVCVTCICV